MSEYQTIFDARGGHYNLANHRYPEARAEEAHAILAHLDLGNGPGGTWLDLAAGGGYLAERARAEGSGGTALACDASLPFLLESSRYRGRAVSQYETLPFTDGSFAAAGCLAAFHHAEDPAAIVAEMLRVTAPGGRAAVGDVAPGSRPAAFLNDFVDRHTPMGHHGRFMPAERLEHAFAAAGGRRIRAEVLDLAWRFPSRAAALEFSRELFGVSATDRKIGDALDALGLEGSDSGALLPWRMVFVSAER